METINTKMITVETVIKSPVAAVWQYWTLPEHVTKWSNASDDWHTPHAENDLRVGGKFLSRMEAKDGSMGFDFWGTYDAVKQHELIEYTMGDGRKVKIVFSDLGHETKVTETFEPENENSLEMQRGGWQSILDNFRKYAENQYNSNSLHYEITIDAQLEKVFSRTFDAKTYSAWTAAFNPTSHFKGSWEKGSKILFLGTDQNGNEGGMVSRIKENIPNKFVSIEHIGILKDGQEVMSGPEVDTWAGATENYTFKETKGKTLFIVDMQGLGEFKDYMMATWPKALALLKSVCEAD